MMCRAGTRDGDLNRATPVIADVRGRSRRQTLAGTEISTTGNFII